MRKFTGLEKDLKSKDDLMLSDWENSIIEISDKYLSDIEDLFREFEDIVYNYSKTMSEDYSSRFPISKSFMNIEGLSAELNTRIDAMFSSFSESARNLYLHYSNRGLERNAIKILSEYNSSILTSISLYSVNIKDCIERAVIEVTLFRNSISDEEYIESLRDKLEFNNIIEYEGTPIVYVDRNFDSIIKLLEDKKYNILYAKENYIIYFKGNSIITIPTITPMMVNIQCSIIKTLGI